MRVRTIAFSLCFLSLGLPSSQASAQQDNPALGPMRPAASPRTEIRVNSNFNISEPIATTDKAALAELEAAAHKTIYEIAGRECQLLIETIAQECRIDSLNINSNVQNQNFRSDPSTPLLNTTANVSFRIVPKN